MYQGLYVLNHINFMIEGLISIRDCYKIHEFRNLVTMADITTYI